jgi:hypothetical protein
MTTRIWSVSAIVLLSLSGGASAADDIVRLGGKGVDAAIMTLKGSDATAASTIEVFHGRLLACLCHKHRNWGYSPTYSNGGYACYGCYGCYGGCYGYSGQSYAPSYAAPAPANGAAQTYTAPAAPSVAQAYSPGGPAMGVYGAQPPAPSPRPTFTVTTPRFSVSLGNGVIIGRAALDTGRLTGLTEQPIDAPPSERMPRFSDRAESLPTPRARPGQTFRYDGGPASPVPMPATRPVHEAPRPGVPANRVKLSPKGKLAYPAYGEQPLRPEASTNVLVKSPAR